MPMLEVKNRDYQDRVEAAITEAIYRASLAEDGKTSVLFSGEIVQACLNTIALLAGTSEATGTPQRTRQFAEECAKALRGRVAAVREKHASGELGFLNVIHVGDRQ